MKKLLKQLSKSYILLFTLTIIMLFFSLGISYIKNYRALVCEEEYYTGKKCIQFSINKFQESSYKEILSSLMKNNSYNLFNTRMFGDSFRAQGIYLTENLKVTPSLIEGRFFTKNDFTSSNNENLAVIGKGLLDKIETLNDEKYILFNNKKYKVIGVVGDKKSQKMLDYTLIFNLKDLFNDAQFPKINDYWYLSSNDNNANLYGVIDVTNASLAQYSTASITASKYNIKPNPTLTALKGSKNITIYFGVFTIVIALNIFIIVKQWIWDKAKEIGVRKAFGAKNSHIYLLVFKEYTLISVASSLVALIIQSLLIEFNIVAASMGLVIFNLLAITIFSLIFSSILLAISIKELNKLPENSIMKGSL